MIAREAMKEIGLHALIGAAVASGVCVYVLLFW